MLPKPETVLHQAEIEQSRRMALTGLIFNILAVASWPIIGGDPKAKLIATISLALGGVNNAALFWATSNARRYTQGKIVAYFVVASILNAGVIYFLPGAGRAGLKPVEASTWTW